MGSIEPEICTKMLRNLSEKLVAKSLTASRGYSMAKFARPDEHAFSEGFEREASPVEGQSLQQKDRKRRKKQTQKKLKKREACACSFENVKRDASRKKGWFSCCKCLFE